MGLPVNIESLIHGKTVEWERLEFKKGWNPEAIVHSLCAFANDLNNWGGGYIIIGVDEKDGQPILPPGGLPQNQLDNLQGEILKLAYQLQPNYFPVMQPIVFQDKHILVLWCPAGDNRPYTAPSTLGEKAQRYPYIRFGSRSIIAKNENLHRLNELTARIPFDDRVNNHADVHDLDMGLIRNFLYEIKSSLAQESSSLSIEDIARQMNIAKGPDEFLKPVNAGLLFFTHAPENFFPRCWIELVWHKDDSGRNFTEKIFKGPIHLQLRATLDFIQNNIIQETVTKVSYKAEATRAWNFPFDAVEEALANAVYHKSYELGKPIEIQIWKDKIEILSFPGPVPPVDAQILRENKRIVARDYRNRRIGDFLKELHLTEGRGTGFPTIYKAMEDNDSPDPIFDTDRQSTYFLTTLPANTGILDSDQVGNQDKAFIISTIKDVATLCEVANDQVSDQVGDQVNDVVNAAIHSKVSDVLNLFLTAKKRTELFGKLGITNHSSNRKRYLDPLLDYGWVEMLYPDRKTSPKQMYQTTASGKRLLKLLTNSQTVHN
jgi:ATP-dependent DNA helicase RecG